MFYLVVKQWFGPLHAVQEGFGERELVFGQIRVFSIAPGVVLRLDFKKVGGNKMSIHSGSSRSCVFFGGTNQIGGGEQMRELSHPIAQQSDRWFVAVSFFVFPFLFFYQRTWSCSVSSGGRLRSDPLHP